MTHAIKNSYFRNNHTQSTSFFKAFFARIQIRNKIALSIFGKNKIIVGRRECLAHSIQHLAETHLEEQHERHPLVIAVVRPVLVIVPQPGMRHLRPHGLPMLVRQRERISNPAEGVNHVIRYTAVVDALDRITDEVVRRNDYTAQEQNGGGDPVVRPEHDVVDGRLVDQVADLHEARHRGDHTEDAHFGGCLVGCGVK